MNKRIQELAMQAFIADSVERNPRYKRSENTNIIMKDLAGFNKKFAELIVKECMGCCGQVAEDAHKLKSSSFLTQDGKQLYNGVWGGAMNCGSAIANHFGVEK